MPNLNSHFHKLGFTLIELLIVITVIGILSALVLSNMQGVRERARDARRKSDLNSIKTALRLYYNDQKVFPDSSSGQIVGCGGGACSWGESQFAADGTIYINTLPTDPSHTDANPVSYTYIQVSADSYALVATLENKSDPDIAESQARCNNVYTPTDPANAYLVCE